MAKVMKSYRMEQFTLDRLSALCKAWDLSETSAIQVAINEMYFREIYDKKKED